MVERIIIKMKGNLLAFGIEDENLLEQIQKNKNIFECNLLNSKTLTEEMEKGSSKNIDAKKLKKIYKKNGVENILINQAKMNFLEKKLIPIFVKIVKGQIIIYGIQDMDKVVRKYGRYTKNMKIEKKEKMICIAADTLREHRLLKPFYYVVDCVTEMVSFISELLTS